ncbi:MAG: 3-dehydroquinate synthase [Deltaproteobacteria bacterium]|nr:3-dehydroquinate synthase [Deltaproteobacteria bacterium]
MNAPGAFTAPAGRWGPFEELCRTLPSGCFVLVDARVLRLHPAVGRALARRAPLGMLAVKAGEGAKSFRTLEKVLRAMAALPRAGTLVAVGGGTVGDLAAVAAHLHRRGTNLLHVPTTLLAAVDSSLGGKGALNLEGAKNAVGVFHSAASCWLCPELFETLSPAQRREGRVEAWKMVLTLAAPRWEAWAAAAPSDEEAIREGRALKAAVCAEDPYERLGRRAVLNFGHTFGHVLESHSGYRLRHGEAVGLGMLCALDVGRALAVTPAKVAREVEAVLLQRAEVQGRAQLARWLGSARQVGKLLAVDKKAERPGEVRMVLLERPGATRAVAVPAEAWRHLLRAWKAGRRP